jgi:FixJ family two-component response regulator
MPDMDGLKLQAVLRERVPHLSIVFVTGDGEVPDSVSAMKAGAVDFLEKPVDSGALFEAIDRALARTVHLKRSGCQASESRAR